MRELIHNRCERIFWFALKGWGAASVLWLASFVAAAITQREDLLRVQNFLFFAALVVLCVVALTGLVHTATRPGKST
jgi:hypothetical protein